MSESTPPPPATITPDDYHAADPARRRLAPKSSFGRRLSLKIKKKNIKPPLATASVSDFQPSMLDSESQTISLDSSNISTAEDDRDQYEWAVVYENQRGITIFSIPYYSRSSLLPSDPSPFTVPNTSSKQSEQLPVTLDNYPLPDGVWRWVSKCWMIDMRTDSGEVQHDGFEYNWMFRSHKWRPGVGPLGAGGWVRRRRWVRLMMRPAQTRHERIGPTLGDHALATADLYFKNGISESFPSQPSVRSDHLAEDVDDIWLDEDVERNWGKCRALMKKVGHDGRKLELWQLWLSQVHSGQEKGRERLREGDTQIQVSPSLPDMRIPRRGQLLAVLKLHGLELAELFVYPDSRAKMVRMLESMEIVNSVIT